MVYKGHSISPCLSHQAMDALNFTLVSHAVEGLATQPVSHNQNPGR